MPNGLIAKYLGLAGVAILMIFSNLVYVLIFYIYICIAPTAYRRLRGLTFHISYALKAAHTLETCICNLPTRNRRVCLHIKRRIGASAYVRDKPPLAGMVRVGAAAGTTLGPILSEYSQAQPGTCH